ncbi:MAG: LysM domain-containing protein, partial [Thermoanaerobaculia bacterium]
MQFSSATVRRQSLHSVRSLAFAALGLAFAGVGTAATEPAAGAPAVDKSEWESGWHVVRPGDTLEGLAERFLGTHELWRELHLLNPFVKDP